MASAAPAPQAIANTAPDRDALRQRRLLVEGDRPHRDAQCACGRKEHGRRTRARRATMSRCTTSRSSPPPNVERRRRPTGSPSYAVVDATASVPTVRSTASRPSVMTAIENSGSPIIGRMTSRSMTRPKHGQRRRRPRRRREPDDIVVVAEPSSRDAPVDEQHETEPRADQGDRALGEVDGLCRLEDEHEAERDERVDRRPGRAPDERLDEAVESRQPMISGSPPPWPRRGESGARCDRRSPMVAGVIGTSTRRARRTARCIALRFTFCVAVSSPSSWSSSLGIIRNFLICSTVANRSLVSLTIPWISSRTSGFSDRSR